MDSAMRKQFLALLRWQLETWDKPLSFPGLQRWPWIREDWVEYEQARVACQPPSEPVV